MSKLPNAPLIEVIFEIKWDITNKTDIIDFQYLYGDLYSNFKDQYPYRENLVPSEIPFDIVRGLPVFRFRVDKNSYPLVQIGPGVLTINTIDSKYFWEEFRSEASKLLSILNEIYPKYKDFNLSPALTYIDFFDYDKEKMTSLDFINTYLQLNISESFINSSEASLSDINLKFNYKLKNDICSLNLSDGKVNNRNGIILQTKVIGEKAKYSKDLLETWIDTSHELSSDIFKSLTKGELFETFKQS